MKKDRQFGATIAVVTGAAQGIGAAVARALAHEGATVALLDRNADALHVLADELVQNGARAMSIPIDLRDSAAIDAAIADVESRFGSLDLLVNVAGVLHPGETVDVSDEHWEDSFAINTTAVFKLCRAAVRGMRRRRRGCIVTVGSNAAHVPRLGMAAYAASKAATAHFMRCLALELAPYGVRCNTVSPGSTDTPMQRAFASTPEQIQAVLNGSLERYRLGIPLGRIAAPADIADAVCFLASERARHITMQDICIDGGAALGAR